MSDEVRVNKEEGIIEIVSSSTLTRQDMESTKAKIQKIFTEMGFRRILIDTTRIQSTPLTVDIFEALEDHPKNFRIAILVTASSPIVEDVLFAENVAVNRGQTLKVFWDQEKAREWLRISTDA